MASSPIVDLKTPPQEKSRLSDKGHADAPAQDALPETLTWRAPEFAEYEKGFWWYVSLFGISALLIAASVFIENYTAAMLFGLSTAVVFVFARKPPKECAFAAHAKGVQIDERLYPYDALRSFWIFYDPPRRAELSLRSRQLLMPYIRVPIGSVNPAQLHRLLSRFLPEAKHADSLADTLSHRAGF